MVTSIMVWVLIISGESHSTRPVSMGPYSDQTSCMAVAGAKGSDDHYLIPDNRRCVEVSIPVLTLQKGN